MLTTERTSRELLKRDHPLSTGMSLSVVCWMSPSGRHLQSCLGSTLRDPAPQTDRAGEPSSNRA